MAFRQSKRSCGVSFWQGKKVLITGAGGFLGAHLTKALLASDAEVTTLSRSNLSRSFLAIEQLIDKITHQEYGSVENLELLNDIIRRHNIEIVYHLAALPLVELGQGNPIATFEVNIRGTWNVLEAVRINKVEKIVAVSTAHVYGDNPSLPYKEEYYPQPSRPYETSKAAADLLAQSYADTYGLGVEIPRFVNIYGPGDLNFTRIVPKIIKTVLSGGSPKLWDNGAVRDFLFVDDAVSALLVLVEKNLDNSNRNRIFNFGSGKPVAISELVENIVRIAKVPDVSITVEPTPEDRKKEILRQYVSIDKAKAELGWLPQTKLIEGLARTIDWYKSHGTF